MIRLLVAALAAALPTAAPSATPGSLVRELGHAKGGESIRLEPGEYGEMKLVNRTFDPPITIRGGTFTGVKLDRVSGVTLVGAKVRAASLPYPHSPLVQVLRSSNVQIIGASLSGPGDKGQAIKINDSRNFRVSGADISRLLRGIVVVGSAEGIIAENRISQMTGDGINLADSHRLLVDRNSITDFAPLPGFHPDAIQMWSVKGKQPQSDIVITRNLINCACQGITQFDHDQGGSDGVIISGNDVTAGYPQGIALYEARRATVSNNRLRTLNGARWRSSLNISGGSVKATRNRIEGK